MIRRWLDGTKTTEQCCDLGDAGANLSRHSTARSRLTAELKSTNASDGGITLGAKNLYELIANAPDDEVSLKKADNHWAEIKSGKVTYRIVCWSKAPMDLGRPLAGL
jgi:hypothetical protein